jgi:hypothetical protein
VASEGLHGVTTTSPPSMHQHYRLVQLLFTQTTRRLVLRSNTLLFTHFNIILRRRA